MSDERRPNVYGVSRDLWEHPMFADEPYTEKQAWAWLIGAAAWKAIPTRGNVGPLNLARGEFSFAVRFLAKKWQWDKSRVHRFIARLIKNDMLSEHKRDSNQVFSINNYNRFQVVGVPKRDGDETAVRQERDSSETGTRHDRDKEETGETLKQGKQEKEEREPSDDGAPATGSNSIEATERSTNDLFEIPTFLDRRPKPCTSAPLAPDDGKLAPRIEAALVAYEKAGRIAGWPMPSVPLSPERWRALAKIIKPEEGFNRWCMALAKGAASKFMRGDNSRGWRPTGIDWFMKPANFNKILEGAYDDGPAGQNAKGFDALREGARMAAAHD